MKLQFCWQIFEKYSVIKFHENPSGGSMVVPWGQTDRCELIVVDRNFANARKNSRCCLRITFMCFVWISEQTAIISLYSIHRLVFITEIECVYCAVRNESLNITEDKFSFWRANNANKKWDVTVPYSSICSILTGPALYRTHQTRPAMFVRGLARLSPWTSRSPCWGCCH
jgi:hypothetical protein